MKVIHYKKIYKKIIHIIVSHKNNKSYMVNMIGQDLFVKRSKKHIYDY